MAGVIKLNAELRRKIEQASHSDVNMCWTCGSCDFECPVNIATGRLRPQRIVRLAYLGMLDELLHLQDIWYCLTCRRCMQVCPNAVKPSTLIEYIRHQALSEEIVSTDVAGQYNDLFASFQRVRWHAVNHCFNQALENFTEQMWNNWQKQPVSDAAATISHLLLTGMTDEMRALMALSRTSACFTCGECDSACPIFCGREVFEPRAIFRMVNLGMVEELMRTPSPWLCIACGCCTDACSQLVNGQEIIEQIKKMAVRSGVIDGQFHLRVEQANQLIFDRFLEKIDLLLGLSH